MNVLHQVCPQCGAERSAEVAEGLCPACLFAAVLADDAPEEDESPDAVRFGDFVILEQIARGGAGVVYRARQRSLGRIVVLKIISGAEADAADFLERFRIEAEAVASLDHPHIVAVHAFGEQGGQYFLAMQFMAGGSLARHGAEEKGTAFLPEAAAGLVATVARAVHHAHQRGILHRDIKPANILLDAAGEPHLADFGLATVRAVLEDDPPRPSLRALHLSTGQRLAEEGEPFAALESFAEAARLDAGDAARMAMHRLRFSVTLANAPQLERQLAHPAGVRSAAFNAGGDRIVTACADGQARVWDAATSELVGAPIAAGGPLRWAGFSPDGARVAMRTEAGAVQLHRSDDAASVGAAWPARPLGRADYLRRREVAFSRLGRWLAVPGTAAVAVQDLRNIETGPRSFPASRSPTAPARRARGCSMKARRR